MSPPSVFRVTVEPLEEACVIRVSGEIDMSTAGQIELALEAARRERRTALLDLGGVEFMDSSGLHVLLDASEQVDDSSWGFFVVRPSHPVQRLLALTGVASRVPLVLPSEGPTPAFWLSGPADARPWNPVPAAAAASNGTAG